MVSRKVMVSSTDGAMNTEPAASNFANTAPTF